LFAQLGGLGLGVTATKHLAELRDRSPEEAGRIAGGAMTTALLSYATMAAILAAAAEPLAAKGLNDASLAPLLRWMSIYLVIAGVNGVQVGVLAGFEEFRRIARINVGRALVYLPFTVAGAWFLGLLGVVLAMVGVALIVGVVFQVEVRRSARRWGTPMRYSLDRAHARIWWRFSLPAFLAGNLVIPATWVVNAILVHQPDGYAEMGVLNAATQWRALVILVPSVANRVILSVQSNLLGDGDSNRYDRATTGMLGFVTVVTSVFAGVVIVVAPYIMSAYGESFGEGASTLRWLALSWLCLAPTWVFWNVLVSSGRVWQGLVFNGIGGGILVMLAWAWREAGSVGIAQAYLVSAGIQLVIQGGHYAAWRRTKAA